MDIEGKDKRRFCEGKDQGFYNRNHMFALRQNPENPFFAYHLDPESIKISKHRFSGILLCSNNKECKLSVTLEFYECGAMRVVMEEPQEGRFRASSYVLVEEKLIAAKDTILIASDGTNCIIFHRMKISDNTFDGYKTEGECKYFVNFKPFFIKGFYNGDHVFTINQQQLLNYEFQRSYEKLMAKSHDSADLLFLFSLWEETPLSNRTSCPKGPQSVALDFSFHGLPQCYGLPERFRKHQLFPTGSFNSNPYRLYNLDLNESDYVNQSLYGNIPFIIANNVTMPYNGGVLWLNASDTYIDFKMQENDSSIHFISECGVLESFTFMGSSPMDIAMAYGEITGKTPLPQFFTLGYHQCRWDALTQEDIEEFNKKFEEVKIPCDCLWLDIDHTDAKKYFTWDYKLFPDPLSMIKKIEDKGRHLVVIVDPHLKVDPEYSVYKNAIEKSIY